MRVTWYMLYFLVSFMHPSDPPSFPIPLLTLLWFFLCVSVVSPFQSSPSIPPTPSKIYNIPSHPLPYPLGPPSSPFIQSPTGINKPLMTFLCLPLYFRYSCIYKIYFCVDYAECGFLGLCVFICFCTFPHFQSYKKGSFFKFDTQ